MEVQSSNSEMKREKYMYTLSELVKNLQAKKKKEVNIF